MCTMRRTCVHALKVWDLLCKAAIGIQGAGQFAALLNDACASMLCASSSARLRQWDAGSSSFAC
jgi:hypothetical protein